MADPSRSQPKPPIELSARYLEKSTGSTKKGIKEEINRHDRIVVNPKVLVGKPVTKGTRLSVEFILELLAERWSHEQILKSYPKLTEEDIWAVLRYAAETIKQEKLYPVPV